MCKILTSLCTRQGRDYRRCPWTFGKFSRLLKMVKVVGTARFELATSRTPSVRATRLRYVPTGDLTTMRQIREGRIAVASALTRLSPPFEKRQESVQRVAQIEQHPAAEQLRSAVSGVIRAAVRRIVGAAFFAQVAAR